MNKPLWEKDDSFVCPICKVEAKDELAQVLTRKFQRRGDEGTEDVQEWYCGLCGKTFELVDDGAWFGEVGVNEGGAGNSEFREIKED